MDFIAPGLLGSAREFDSQYCKPLKNIDSDTVGLGQQIRQDIGNYLLRRMKNDILSDLPPKYIKSKHETSAVMPKGQLERYQLELEEAKKLDPAEKGSRNKMLSAIWALRAISDHPFILEKQIERFDSDELIASSAKLEVTCRILDQIKPKKEKVILFSDRKGTQRLLAKIIRERYGLSPSVINGDTPAYKANERSSIESRQQAIDRFEAMEGFNAIILSPLATGVGLNITRANHVIHYTRHWNPAKEDQATDRVHRIGQTKEVHVYYPMAIAQEFKTFDVVLDELLERKRILATASLFPTDQAEVDPLEVFGNLAGQETGQFGTSPILIEDADKLDPLYFEALIASLFQKQGHRVQLTPKSNDKGADVVVRNGNDNFLIQVKHSNRELGHEAIGEILKARGYYQNKYQTEFSLRIVTNRYLNKSARKLAEDNKIVFLDRGEIARLLCKYEVTLRDILTTEKSRLAEI
jgi:restriction endonuclease Mrr